MTYPMCRRSWTALTLVMSSAPSKIRPDDDSTSRLIIFIVVVLPQPDGPIRQTSSPAGMSRSSSATATVPPG